MSLKYLTDIDLNNNELQNVVIQNLASDPATSSLKEGQFWINTSLHKLKYFDGTSIITIGDISKAFQSIGTVATSPTTNWDPSNITSAEDTSDIILLMAGNNMSISLKHDTVSGLYAYRLDATNTTYSAGTEALLTSGTDTANRVWQAKILHDYIASAIGAADAMRFKGTIGTGGDVTALPTTGVQVGDTYRVITAGTYAGQTCEIGDLIIATATTPTWTVAQTNIDGAITSISSGTGISVTGSGASRTVALASGVATAGSKGDTTNQTPTWGGTFKVTSETIDTYGRTTALAEHTVTIPNATATTSAAGLMSATDKAKIDSAPSRFVETNPALSPSSGVCTWEISITGAFGNAGLPPVVQVYDSAGNMVMTDVTVSRSVSDQVTLYVYIKIISSAAISAGAYKAVIIFS